MTGWGKAIHVPIPFHRFHAVMIWNSLFFFSFREGMRSMPGYNIVGRKSNLNKEGAKNSQLPSGSAGGRWLERLEGIRLDSHPLISYIGTKG
jgi:hypothetical protein